LSNPSAIFAGSPPRFTRSRVTYEAYVVSGPSTRPQVDSAIGQALITALATLLGAGVGGFTTYFTSKAAFTRQESAEAKRQHDALMRGVSVRFVKALDKLQGESGSSKLKELVEGFDEIVSSNQDAKNLFEQIKAGTSTTTPEQATEILCRAVEPTLNRHPLRLNKLQPPHSVRHLTRYLKWLN